MSRRVVVTGMGAVTPIGIGVENFWNGIKNNQVGIQIIDRFDPTEFKAKVAAQVNDFNPKDYMDPKSAKRMDKFCQYAVAAAKEAVEDANLCMENEDPYLVGVSIGSGVGSLEQAEVNAIKLKEKGPSRINPLLVPELITNMAAGNVSIAIGAKGKSINVVTACATGSHSIGEAFRSIQCGDADVMIAGGTESCITPLGVGGFAALTALSTSEDPMCASRPFDKDRDGFVMGEGAGVVILETLEHAQARNAKIYAEIVGYGATSDAYHITSPAEDGEGAKNAMLFALKDANVAPEEITYINAHGTSTHHNDLFETRAIKKAFGKDAYNVKISSTKSMVGHLLGAAGAVEFITAVKSINDNYIHPNVGLKETEEEMDLDYVKDNGINCNVDVVMSNSLGFGGHNATLIVRKYK